ncbi:MAG: lauroyl acyltransferase [Mariprofundaceae bacterium]
MQYFSVTLVKTLFWLIRLLPVRIAGALGASLGRIMFYIVKRHRNIAINNLTRVYPQKSRHWRVTTARKSFAELGRTTFEFPHVFLRSKAFLLSHVKVEGESILRDAMAKQQGVIIAAAHHSNWELGALMFSLLGYDSHIIYRPMNNAYLETYLKQCRERFGTQMQSRNAGLRWLPKALKQGRAIGVMIDQHMSQGTAIPFLGHMASTTTMPAAFILRQKTPTIGVALERHGHNFNFTLRFWEINTPTPQGDKKADTFHTMQAICDSFAPVIHAHPELWLWLHRRWLLLEQNPEMMKVIHGAP